MLQIFPFSVWDCPWLAPLALALDLVLGDPLLPWPHPVCLIGRYLDFMEPVARLFASRGSLEQECRRRARLAGILSLVSGCIIVYLCTRFLLALPIINIICAIYLSWAGLAMGCLLKTGKLVLQRIEKGDLTEAREACGWLVSRDVNDMDKKTLRKTLADTLSENFTDAFTAPFFWLLLTGPVGLWLYKTVSTMDSQWGYLTEKWRDLGRCGAKMDDCLAWLPARISPLMLLFTHNILSRFPALRVWTGSWPGYKRISRQAKGMPSPNSGWSMASCAWLCNGRMAGPSRYFGEIVPKQWLGPPQDKATPWSTRQLLALCSLMFYGSILGGFLLWLAVLLAVRILF